MIGAVEDPPGLGGERPSGHDSLPTHVAHLHLVVVGEAHPHCRGEVGREAHEPGVGPFLGRAGLAAGRLPVGDPGPGSGAPAHVGGQGVGGPARDLLADHPHRLEAGVVGTVIDGDPAVALLSLYPLDEVRLAPQAAGGDGGVSLGHVEGYDLLRAQRHRPNRVDLGGYAEKLSGLHDVSEPGELADLEEPAVRRRGELVDDRGGLPGLRAAIVVGRVDAVGLGGIGPLAGPFSVDDVVGLQARPKGGDEDERLEGRSGLPLALGGEVELGLLVEVLATDHGPDGAGLGLDGGYRHGEHRVDVVVHPEHLVACVLGHVLSERIERRVDPQAAVDPEQVLDSGIGAPAEVDGVLEEYPPYLGDVEVVLGRQRRLVALGRERRLRVNRGFVLGDEADLGQAVEDDAALVLGGLGVDDGVVRRGAADEGGEQGRLGPAESFVEGSGDLLG